MKKKLLALVSAACMLLSLSVGCGQPSPGDSAASAPATASAAAPSQAPAESTPPASAPADPASAQEMSSEEPERDFTQANADMDFTGYKELLRGLTTSLPITQEPVTLSYFFGFEGTTLNYIPGGTMEGHQVWAWLAENTGITFDLRVVNKANETDQFNLMIASGDYTDLVPAGDYSAGVEAAYEEDIYLELSDLLEENMPNYWEIIHSDQRLLENVRDGDKFLAIYALKDQVANPAGVGTFIRRDWLEELGLEVPQTYEELTRVLEAFQTEKGATEPMSLLNTISMQNGLLMGGFGSLAELSSNGMGDSTAGFYQEEGRAIYGATADGTRKFLSWLHALYEKNLIHFENMQARDVNPFSQLNAGEASDGSTGYIFTNQPFGGEYSKMAAQSGDTACDWWPVPDVAETAGATIPFYEEVNLIDMTSLAVTTQCKNVETALQFLDYGYSYEGSLLYNFGFEEGSGHPVETWHYDEAGEPMFDEAALAGVAEATNIASGVVSTKDLAGVVFDTRLSFSFGERERACFDAWSTNKNTSHILGSSTTLTAQESTDASALYSDIISYVATSSLQFINGDQNIDDDGVWAAYVANIEAMGLSRLTDIIQGAYDRANG